MDDERGSKRDEDRKPEPPPSDLGPGHCPNCGGVDFYELQECGEVREVCVDCGRRVLASA